MVSALDRSRLLQGRSRSQPGDGVFHRHPAAQRHRPTASRARAQRHAAGHDRPHAPDAGLQHAVGARHRSRRHRHAERGREATSRRRARIAIRLGREEFVERVWEWRETYGGRILHQLRRLGASCDWSRERFTLDRRTVARRRRSLRRCSISEGLIYRGPPADQLVSAMRDGAVRPRSRSQGRAGQPLVHPISARRRLRLDQGRDHAARDDARRYRRRGASRGRALPRAGRQEGALPLIGREIPIIADAAVDSAFGTGAVKITPAHDFNDFEMGRRHGLPQISVMDTRARMNDRRRCLPGPDARRRRASDRRRSRGAGPARKGRAAQHTRSASARAATPSSSRCSPSSGSSRVNKRWPTASRSPMQRSAVERATRSSSRSSGRTLFFDWMENIHDWCISRQLWWGHRIPAYRCERCDAPADRRRGAPDRVPGVRRHRSACRTTTCSTPGSRRGCGRSRRSDGPSRRPT